MTAALLFILHYEKIENDDEDSDASSSEDEMIQTPQVVINKEAVKMMMLKVIARTVGLHHLILLNFTLFFRDMFRLSESLLSLAFLWFPVTNSILFKLVPPDSAIAVGNMTREICLCVPLLMTEDLLQNLALYKKSHEKAVSAAARSLITLFREVCPSLLVKDHGRPMDPNARPRAYGEVNVLSNVSDIELLEHEDEVGMKTVMRLHLLVLVMAMKTVMMKKASILQMVEVRMRI
ncbi:hypothetical protein CRYUN_Cryun21dG0058600 [Craigia yunnanensis]